MWLYVRFWACGFATSRCHTPFDQKHAPASLTLEVRPTRRINVHRQPSVLHQCLLHLGGVRCKRIALNLGLWGSSHAGLAPARCLDTSTRRTSMRACVRPHAPTPPRVSACIYMHICMHAWRAHASAAIVACAGRMPPGQATCGKQCHTRRPSPLHRSVHQSTHTSAGAYRFCTPV